MDRVNRDASHLPPALRAVVPELDELPEPTEPRADCARCVMTPPRVPEAHPWAFSTETRCCTYHPELPNYLCGRALARDDAGAARLRARLEDPSGVTAWGVREPASWAERRVDSKRQFGRDVAIRCPMWIGGELSCGIWRDRTGVCRSWFCKHEHGALSRARWRAIEGVFTHLEDGVARLLVARGTPPDRADGWEAWFRDCAARADALTPADLAPLRDRLTDDLLERWRALHREAPAALPERPVPRVSHGLGHDGRVAIEGYTDYDGVQGPPAVLDFFAALDGARTWREAAAVAGLTDHAIIGELHRIDALVEPPEHPPRHAGPVPEVLVPSVQRPIAIADKVWLRGDSPVASLVAPQAVFRLLALLDGQRPWRDAVAEVNAAGIDAALIEALYRIGGLSAARA